MPFQKGHKKVGGRQKGGQNRLNRDLRESIHQLIDDNWDKVNEDLSRLNSKERIEIIIKFMDFALPKLNKVNIENSPIEEEVEHLTEEELKDRIRKLSQIFHYDDLH